MGRSHAPWIPLEFMASIQPSLIDWRYAPGMRFLVLASSLVLAACSSDIYVRDGVTNGDTFYLAPQAMMDDNPVLQSWTSYSLTRSACQLEIGGPNPARANSYSCELTARQHLLDTWSEQQIEYPGVEDNYLDTLAEVRSAGFLDEYVVHYFGTKGWQVPAEVDRGKFRTWQQQYLSGHRPVTRIVGSWNYSRRVEDELARQ